MVHPVQDPWTRKEVVTSLPDSKEESRELKIVIAMTVAVVVVVVVCVLVVAVVVELLVVLPLELVDQHSTAWCSCKLNSTRDLVRTPSILHILEIAH